MKQLLLLLFLFFSFANLSAQISQFSLSGSRTEPMDIVRVESGGYVICGKGATGFYSRLYPEMGIKKGTCFVLKVDEKGDTVWVRNLPGLEAQHVLQADDGGFLVSGFSRGHREKIYNGDKGQGIFLIKVDPDGNPEWGKMLEHPENCTTEGMTKRADGTIAVLGVLERRFVIFLVNQNGSEAGKITPYGYAPPQKEDNPDVLRYSIQRDIDHLSSGGWGYDLAGTQDGGLAMIGAVGQGGLMQNAWFMQRFDSTGRTSLFEKYRWKRAPDGDLDFNPKTDDDNWGRSIWAMKNGDFLLGGLNHYHSHDFRMTRVSPKGEIRWTASFKGEMLGDELNVLEMADGNCVLAGTAEGYNRVFIAKVDPEGKTLWEKEYPEEKGLRFGAICEAPSGGLTVTGNSRGRTAVFVMFLDHDGNLRGR